MLIIPRENCCSIFATGATSPSLSGGAISVLSGVIATLGVEPPELRLGAIGRAIDPLIEISESRLGSVASVLNLGSSLS